MCAPTGTVANCTTTTTTTLLIDPETVIATVSIPVEVDLGEAAEGEATEAAAEEAKEEESAE
jgi:hypothetical protein